MLERARQLPNKMKQQRRERKSTVPEVSFDNLCAYISLVVVLESTCVQSMLCLTHALFTHTAIPSHPTDTQRL